MQFSVNLEHLISACNLGFSYNYSLWFQVYTDWKDISEVIRSSVFKEDQQDLIDIFDIQVCVRYFTFSKSVKYHLKMKSS